MVLLRCDAASIGSDNFVDVVSSDFLTTFEVELVGEVSSIE
jgi:hypothetical protein